MRLCVMEVNLAEVAISLAGELFHSDARALADQIGSAFDKGGCVVEVTPAFQKIDFGALQVLVAAAKEADDRGLTFSIKATGEDNAVSGALAQHGLSDAVPVIVGPLSEEALEQ